MSAAPSISVILNAGSGHGDASTCEREIRAGFEAEGRAPHILVAESPAQVEQQTRLAMEVPRTQPQVVVAAGAMAPSIWSLVCC
jgi:diacylglycerol kinase family enzyme